MLSPLNTVEVWDASGLKELRRTCSRQQRGTAANDRICTYLCSSLLTIINQLIDFRVQVASDLLAAAERHRAEYPDMDISLPAALVPCSAASGEGVADLAAALQARCNLVQLILRNAAL